MTRSRVELTSSNTCKKIASKSTWKLPIVHIRAEQSPSGIPPPTNLQLRRVSPTAIEVTWDPPPYSGVQGYRLYYDMYPEHDAEHWHIVEVGPYTVAEISGLEPHSDYAVRVRAKIAENRFSNFSETVVTSMGDHGTAICIELFKFCYRINFMQLICGSLYLLLASASCYV